MKRLAALMASALLAAESLLGAAPAIFNYQGKLTDALGNPRNTPVPMVFRIYDAANGGTLRVSYAPVSSVPVVNGVFGVLVGDAGSGTVTPGADADLTAALSGSGNRYLEVVVNGVPLSPRQRLAAVPYAMSVATGSVTDASVAANAGIAYSKLSLGYSVVDGDIVGMSWSKLSGVPAELTDGDDVDDSVNGGGLDGVFSTNGLLRRTGAGTYSTTADNTGNWDTAYSERLQWDGGATGLNASTGRTSLGLGTLATQSSISNGDLTSGTYSNITGLGAQAQDLGMNSHRITGLSDPQNPDDAATMNYVDIAVGGAGGGTITGVTAGDGLAGGGTTGSVTLDVGAGTGITVAANAVSVNYGAAAGTAVQGNTQVTISPGTGMSGGGTVTLGSGGTVTLTNAGDTDATDDLTNSTSFGGDVSGTSSNIQLGTGVVDQTELAATAVAAGSYGDASNVPQITVDADGRITGATTVAISGDITDVVAGNGLTGGATNGSATLNVGAGAGITVGMDGVGLDLTSANAWTGAQTFSGGASFPGSGVWNSSGNVGIGTTSPQSALHVNGSIRTDLKVNCADVETDADGDLSCGTDSTDDDVSDLELDGVFATYGAGLLRRAGTASYKIETGTPNYLAKWASPSGETLSDSMIFDDGTNVGIGTANPAARLHVNGTAGNNTGVWQNLSDVRLKRDVVPLKGALSLVMELQGVSFRWKDPQKDEEYGFQRGFIAQDVEKVIPEWVKTQPDGYKVLEKVGVEALLVEAIKEQQRQIEALKRELDVLTKVMEKGWRP